MKLDVITGYREYLAPAPVTEAELVRFLSDASHTVRLASVGWSPRPEQPFDASFALGRNNSRESAVDLLLEYLVDSHGDNDRVAVLLPTEALLQMNLPKKGGQSGGEFIARAAELLGPQHVRLVRLSLSQNSRDVVRTLGRMAGATQVGPAPSGGLETIELEARSASGSLSPYSVMTRNYTQVVLSLCERLVRDKLTFTGAGRVEFVVNEMSKNNLSIRPDLTVDRILETLEPGGEIFELLSRPFATAGSLTP